jgi:nitroreductase
LKKKKRIGLLLVLMLKYEKAIDMSPNESFSNLQKIDPGEFEKVVISRRSVRVFQNISIPEEIINRCLDLALLAPNSSNLQPWEFYWIRTESKKKELAQACHAQPAATTAAELIVCVARTDTWKKNAEKMIRFFSEEKIQVSQATLHYYETELPRTYENTDMLLWSVKSSCLAAENFMLALRSYSFDSCPMEGFDEKKVREILELPEGAYITMVIGAGKRAQNGVYGPRIRFERENFIKEV